MADYNRLFVWSKYYDTSTASWKDNWTVESKDAVDYAKSSGTPYADFGAVGLKPGVRYTFRTAWCKVFGTVTTCNCYNIGNGYLDVDNDLFADTRPADFPSPSLPLTGGVSRKALDEFDRPPTKSKRNRDNTPNGGDGLGPGNWKDDLGQGSTIAGNGAYMAESDGERFAVIPYNSQQLFLPLAANHQHSFAELQFRPYCTPEKRNPPSNTSCNQSLAVNYRVDVQTRAVESAGTAYFYMFQLRYEPDQAGDISDEPFARIIRAGQGLGTPLIGGSAGQVAVVGTGAWDGAVGCEFDGTAQQATVANTGGLRDASPKLVRVRVKDAPQGYPEVFATVAWDLTSGTFKNQCTFKGSDTLLPTTHPLYGEKGGRGYLVHHWDARADTFAAGDQAAP